MLTFIWPHNACITSAGSADQHGNTLWQQRDIMAINPSTVAVFKVSTTAL